MASAAILAPLFPSQLNGAAIGTPKEDADAQSGSERTAWNVVTRALKAVDIKSSLEIGVVPTKFL